MKYEDIKPGDVFQDADGFLVMASDNYFEHGLNRSKFIWVALSPSAKEYNEASPYCCVWKTQTEFDPMERGNYKYLGNVSKDLYQLAKRLKED